MQMVMTSDETEVIAICISGYMDSIVSLPRLAFYVVSALHHCFLIFVTYIPVYYKLINSTFVQWATLYCSLSKLSNKGKVAIKSNHLIPPTQQLRLTTANFI